MQRYSRFLTAGLAVVGMIGAILVLPTPAAHADCDTGQIPGCYVGITPASGTDTLSTAYPRDIYGTRLTAGQRISFELDPQGQDLGLALFAPTATDVNQDRPIAGSNRPGAAREQFYFTVPATGTYFLMVYLSPGVTDAAFHWNSYLVARPSFRVVASVSRSVLPAGRSVTLGGVVIPGAVASKGRVVVQKYASRRWVTLGTLTVTRAGKFSAIITGSGRGTVLFRAYMPPRSGYLGGFSKVLSVRWR